MSNFISDKAKLGKDITFAKNIIIEDDVTIGDNCQLGYNVVIRKGTHNNWRKRFFNFE